MRFVVLPAALCAAVAVSTAGAQGSHVHMSMSDSVARVTERRALDRSGYHIVTRDGTQALLLTDTSIVAELTDAGLRRVSTGIDSGAKTADGFGARLVAGMVGGMLKPMFDHAIEYDLRDLAEARYTDGRLLLRSRSGENVFGDVEFFGHQLSESFSPADAREFAARAERARARLR